MSVLRHTPAFTAADAAAIAQALYGIRADAAALPSERDQNFQLTSANGERFVLKIANGREDSRVLEAQNAALEHLSRAVQICPAVRRTVDGQSLARTPKAWGGAHLVRLFTWIPGVPLADARRKSPLLLENFGRAIGSVDAALATFDHPAVHREFHWDLANALGVVRERLPLIRDAAQRELIGALTDGVEERDAAAYPRLRRSVVHNDPNDHNVLIGPPDGGPFVRLRQVVGLLDFGDMVWSYTVADLAIAIAYAILDEQDILRSAAFVVRGYHSARALQKEEAAALFGLIILRLCTSVAIAAEQQTIRPADPYLSISQRSIRDVLPRLAAIRPRLAAAAFREACGWRRPRGRVRTDEDVARRRERIGSNVRVGYRVPLKAARGWMQYLYDEGGRRYLDAYNNVPHVGHCHPRVVDAAAQQMRVLNTNTRYLQDALVEYADRLCATLPEPLRVCYFVNSGSEANELALRLARAHAKQDGVIVLDQAYHGNTTTLVSISPYKFNGPGGEGAPEWVRVVPLPDVYRGPYRSDALTGSWTAGRAYAAHVADAARSLRASSSGFGAFIAESAPSVAGQIVLPDGYLRAAYEIVRHSGGVCIADEVQTAYGRMGDAFYAFESQQVVPDIVVLGKPIGNGHPIGAVVTTHAIARSFDTGMEFFSTFGGNTVSCAAGLAVLDVVQDERLMDHAREVGDALRDRLQRVADEHPLIGDVRGRGLFLGVELVKDRETLEPAGAEADYVVNRMREEGVLIGTEGPHGNVLKIRPPMPFTAEDAETLCCALDRVFGELE
jgi:4-aminobutyrate aminotransferase-like enzyme/Ser/Thr protein kinase RdoA (MazF antagonist)